MKVALYIEDGLEQIVLTPENDTERMVLAKLDGSHRSIEIAHGGFYLCQGGWVRHSPYAERSSDKSTMIILRQKQADDQSAPS
jgi:hypothetical protein